MIDPTSIGYLIPAIIIALMTTIIVGGIALLWGVSPLLSPGPLTTAGNGLALRGYLSHAQFENDCLLCHTPWAGPSSERCLACHTDVSLEVRQQSNLHGRFPLPLQCSQCHPEHQGRQAQIANVALDTYPHELTHFDLVGSHNNIGYADCHPHNQYRLTSLTCHSCHPEPDVHAGKYGTNCQQCHAVPHNSGFMAEAWNPITLDHAFFSLTGGHAAVACEQCHLTPEFQQTSHDCVACHAEPEVHWGWYGTACATCHTIKRWAPSTFDHNQLEFPLTGRHMDLACQACHPDHQFAGTPAECSDCHREPDFHSSGQFGHRCQMCHGTDGWYLAFLRQHPFPVDHGGLQQSPSNCLTCHPQGYITFNCDACHRAEQVDPAALMN